MKYIIDSIILNIISCDMQEVFKYSCPYSVLSGYMLTTSYVADPLNFENIAAILIKRPGSLRDP
jgi:hypothetical protein